MCNIYYPASYVAYKRRDPIKKKSPIPPTKHQDDIPEDKVSLFIETYLSTWSASLAAKACGYAFPAQQGWYMKHRPDIANAIQERLNEKLLKQSVTADDVIKMVLKHTTNPDPKIAIKALELLSKNLSIGTQTLTHIVSAPPEDEVVRRITQAINKAKDLSPEKKEEPK